MRIPESQRCTEKCCGLFTPLAVVTGNFPKVAVILPLTFSPIVVLTSVLMYWEEIGISIEIMI